MQFLASVLYKVAFSTKVPFIFVLFQDPWSLSFGKTLFHNKTMWGF